MVETMNIYAIRLPASKIKELKNVADAQYIPPRTLVRSWILQRLEAEQQKIERLDIDLNIPKEYS